MRRTIMMVWASVLALVTVLLCIKTCQAEDRNEIVFPSGEVRLGISVGEDGNILNADGSIKFARTSLIFALTEEELDKAVIYLPALSIDYEKEGCSSAYTIGYLFGESLRRFLPREPAKNKKFELLLAEMKPSDANPKKVDWYFTCAVSSLITTATREKEKEIKVGEVRLSVSFDKAGGVSFGDWGVKRCKTGLLHKLSDDQLLEQIQIIPPISVYQFDRVTGNLNKLPENTKDLFARALARLSCQNEKGYTMISAERMIYSSRPVMESWFFFCLPNK